MKVSPCLISFFTLSFLFTSVKTETLVFPPYRHSYGIRKARQSHLTMFLPGVRFDEPAGIAAAKMEARDEAGTDLDDDEVVVYGVNSGKHQIIYNTSMRSLAVYGQKGSIQGCFRNPKGLQA